MRGNFIRNAGGGFQGLHLLPVHKMAAGMRSADHPWVTGLVPTDQRPVWPRNGVFRTPVGTQWSQPNYQPDEDAAITTKVDEFLAAMVKKSVATPEIPHGPTLGAGRGFKGGLYFVARRRIELERYQTYVASGGPTGPPNTPIPTPYAGDG